MSNDPIGTPKVIGYAYCLLDRQKTGWRMSEALLQKRVNQKERRIKIGVDRCPIGGKKGMRITLKAPDTSLAPLVQPLLVQARACYEVRRLPARRPKRHRRSGTRGQSSHLPARPLSRRRDFATVIFSDEIDRLWALIMKGLLADNWIERDNQSMAFKSHKDVAGSSLVFRGKAADLEAIANLLLESKVLSGRVSGQIISRGKVVKVIKRRAKRRTAGDATARSASTVAARQKHLQKTREARAQMVAHITPQVADAYAKANPVPVKFWDSAE